MFPQPASQKLSPLLLAQLDAIATDRISRATKLQNLLMAIHAPPDAAVNYDQIDNLLEALPESPDKVMLQKALAELRQAQMAANESINSLEAYLYQVAINDIARG